MAPQVEVEKITAIHRFYREHKGRKKKIDETIVVFEATDEKKYALRAKRLPTNKLIMKGVLVDFSDSRPFWGKTTLLAGKIKINEKEGE